VQYLFRQRGSLLASSREFRGGLTACLFLVVFRLAVKMFGGFTSAKIRLGGYRQRLGGLSVYTNISCRTRTRAMRWLTGIDLYTEMEAECDKRPRSTAASVVNLV